MAGGDASCFLIMAQQTSFSLPPLSGPLCVFFFFGGQAETSLSQRSPISLPFVKPLATSCPFNGPLPSAAKIDQVITESLCLTKRQNIKMSDGFADGEVLGVGRSAGGEGERKGRGGRAMGTTKTKR
jgi:hypothetical protein